MHLKNKHCSTQKQGVDLNKCMFCFEYYKIQKALKYPMKRLYSVEPVIKRLFSKNQYK